MTETNLRQYRFSVDDRKYVFDGDTLSVFENTEEDLIVDSSRPADKTKSTTFLRSVALNLVNKCNLGCDYCYAKQGGYDSPGVAMTPEIARKAVDLVSSSVVKNNGDCATFGFFGGEPLLAMDLIRNIVDYAESVLPSEIKRRYLVTTNGTLINDEVASYFKEHEFLVTVSIDGSPQTHNSHRKYRSGAGSYNKVVRGIELLGVRGVKTTGRLTVAQNTTDICANVLHVRSLGLRRVTYAVDYKIDDVAFASFMASLEQLAGSYLGLTKVGECFDLTNFTEPIAGIVTKRKKRAHCNAGLSYLSVSADGKIYKCPRFTGDERHGLGPINEAKPAVVIQSINSFSRQLGSGASTRAIECSKCAFVNLCGGCCFHHAVKAGKQLFDTIPRECYYRRRLYGLVLNVLCSLTVPERRNLLLGLTQYWR